MRRKIPSTVALALFESAARHSSFARAAADMYLTESAVSRQIAALESYLGVKLFDRIKKQVVLTEAGRQYSQAIGTNLDEIEMHTTSLMSHRGAGGILELAVIPTFGNRWLIPRLRGFFSQHPSVTINLSERPEPFAFRGTNFDLALHYDHPSWIGVKKVNLFDEEVVPVANPRHFDFSTMQSPVDLLKHVLLYKRSRPDAWPHWFELAGLPADAQWTQTVRMEMYSMVVEAARAGLGVGLVPRIYVSDEIARGDLKIPFDIPLKHEKRYCLIYPDYKSDSPLVQRFTDWVVEEAEVFHNSAKGG
jgi:LysR family transcriptional regulator, glycine cleavage system transcriptional activator